MKSFADLKARIRNANAMVHFSSQIVLTRGCTSEYEAAAAEQRATTTPLQLPGVALGVKRNTDIIMTKSDWDYRGLAAECYDLWFGDEPFWDQAFFYDRIRHNGGVALEIACGTGRLLVPFCAMASPSRAWTRPQRCWRSVAPRQRTWG